jgi:WD40 repeat protein
MGNKSFILNQKKEFSNNQNNNKSKIKDFSINQKEINSEKIKCKSIINEHKKWINCIISLKNKNFASCSGDLSIKIFSGLLKDNFKCLINIENAHLNYILYLTQLINENIVSCSSDGSIKFWNINFEKLNYILLFTLNEHQNDVWKLIQLKNLNLVSCSSDKTIKIWKEKENEINKYEKIKEIKGYNLYIESILEIKTNDNINYLLSGGGDLSIKFYDINNNFNLIFQIDNFYIVHQMSFIQIDNNKICCGGNGNGFISIINFRNFQIETNIKINFNDIYVINLLKNGNIIISGKDKNLIIINKNTYKKEFIKNNIHDDYVHGIIEIDSNYLVTCSSDNTIKVWEIEY